MYYMFSENKGVIVFVYADCWFSHKAVHFSHPQWVVNSSFLHGDLKSS